MNGIQSLTEVDRNILDIISLYGGLEFLDLWYEIGEADALKEHRMTKKELLIRLKSLEAQGYVEGFMNSGKGANWTVKK